MSTAQSLQNLSTSPVVELFMLANYNPTNPTEVFRFTPWRNCLWLGENWTHLDAKTSDFESNGRTLPKPKIQVTNVANTIGYLCNLYRDLLGATLYRYRTPESFIQSGSADLIQVEEWTIQQKLTQTNLAIEWELSALELENRRVPYRAYRSGYCGSHYRSKECGYTGLPVADINNAPTGFATLDNCSQTLGGCRLRFGAAAQLPIDYFPGLASI